MPNYRMRLYLIPKDDSDQTVLKDVTLAGLENLPADIDKACKELNLERVKGTAEAIEYYITFLALCLDDNTKVRIDACIDVIEVPIDPLEAAAIKMNEGD